MITDAALKASIKGLRTFLTGIPVFPRAIWDMDLDFKRVREYLLAEDQAFKDFTGEPNGNWLALVYNRGPIQTRVLGRKQGAIMEGIDPANANLYGWILAKTVVSIVAFSPSAVLIEALEERFAALHIPSPIDFTVKLPPDDVDVIFEVTLDELQSRGMKKEDERNKGSIMSLQMDFAMNYTLVVHKETLPRITTVTLDVYIGDEPTDATRIFTQTATA